MVPIRSDPSQTWERLLYQHLDAAVLRLATERAGTGSAPWPDLTGQDDGPTSWRPWLEQVMRVPGFEIALEQASPSLVGRIAALRDGRDVSERTARRVVLAVMRYRLRACGRATPFGLFAGVAPARIAPSLAIRMGTGHRTSARADARWLAAVVERLEREPALRPRLKAMANNLVFERDGHLILEHRPNAAGEGSPTHVRVRASSPIRKAMNLAVDPIRLRDLADKLAGEFPRVPAGVIDALLADLVTQRLLLTSLRPPMTTPDPLGYILHELDAIAAVEVVEVAGTLMRLCEIAARSARHDQEPSQGVACRHRERLAASMDLLCPAPKPALAVDLRVDWDLTVPQAVAVEAANAAAVLVRLAPRPNLGPGWVSWHGRFLERYGPRALVPILDAVDADIGLGYPAGYLGSAPTPPGEPTARDTQLLALAQNAALRHCHEIRLDEAMIASLAIDPGTHIQPTTELTVRIHAADESRLTCGDFTLSVVGVSRTAGTTTGRFLSLFDAPDQDRMSALYANLPTVSRNAIIAQVSATIPHTSTENVAHAPRVMPCLLPVGEYHDLGGEQRISLDDLAVTADLHGIQLVSLSRQRPVEPMVFNAVELVRHTHPLVRFLIEAPNAMNTPCGSFDWGAASNLPYLPALRHGKTILSPARWRLSATDLPQSAAGWPEWDDAFAKWRTEVALPEAVFLGEGDQRIGLDLSEPAHRALLRAQMEQTGTTALRAGPPPGGAGWVDGRVHELVLPLVAAHPSAREPAWSPGNEVVGRDHGRMPGCEGRFYLKLYAHRDGQTGILTQHLPNLVNELGDGTRWWFLRYHDPHEHLRLRLTVPDDRAAATAARIGAWSQTLRRAGLLTRVQWDTDYPEVARFGGRSAMDAAHAYFAADSAAAIAQLTMSDHKDGPDLRAVTVASMLDIVIGLIGSTSAAMTWLILNARTDTCAPARTMYKESLRLADPTDQHALVALPGGRHLVTSWTRRRAALSAYREALDRPESTLPAELLADLLHLHHVRIAGVDPESERACLHLARAAALSWTARAERTP